MYWGLTIALAALMAVHPAYADKLEEPEQRLEGLADKQDGGSSVDLGSDAYELRQVKRAETDAEECRRRHARYRTKYADDPRLVDILIRRRCALSDELAKEKRRTYEQRKRIAKQQEKG